MITDLAGKTAFITGAASGIGFSIAQASAEAGMNVMLADINETDLQAAERNLLERGFSVGSVLCDVSDLASVEAAAQSAVSKFQKIHLVCNNAGVSVNGRVDQATQADWDWVIGVNYLGVIHGCRTFIPLICSHGEGGHVLNTSSMAGLLGGIAEWGPYNSSKFAVVGLTEVLRQEGKSAGYGASVLCPEGVRTQILRSARNRPKRFANQDERSVDEEETAKVEADQLSLDPDIVGELCLHAVRENRLYVFTHPDYEKLLNYRHAKMMDDLDWCRHRLNAD